MATNYCPDNSSYGGEHATNVMHLCWPPARNVDGLVGAAVALAAAVGGAASMGAAHFGASRFSTFPTWMCGVWVDGVNGVNGTKRERAIETMCNVSNTKANQNVTDWKQWLRFAKVELSTDSASVWTWKKSRTRVRLVSVSRRVEKRWYFTPTRYPWNVLQCKRLIVIDITYSGYHSRQMSLFHCDHL